MCVSSQEMLYFLKVILGGPIKWKLDTITFIMMFPSVLNVFKAALDNL